MFCMHVRLCEVCVCVCVFVCLCVCESVSVFVYICVCVCVCVLGQRKFFIVVRENLTLRLLNQMCGWLIHCHFSVLFYPAIVL